MMKEKRGMTMEKAQILIVDDEWNMRNLLRVYLTRDGFGVIEADNGQEALSKIEVETVDLVILDIMMPGLDGWQVCQEIRKTLEVPILMLTARTEIKDKVKGLNLGADDYLIKPFASEELIARVQALLRRVDQDKPEVQDSSVIIAEDIKIDGTTREVSVKDHLVELTPKEFDALFTMMNHPGRVFSREILLDQVWGLDYLGDFRTVDTHIKNVREKMRKAGLTYNPIKTVWGVGYKFMGLEQ